MTNRKNTKQWWPRRNPAKQLRGKQPTKLYNYELTKKGRENTAEIVPVPISRSLTACDIQAVSRWNESNCCRTLSNSAQRPATTLPQLVSMP